SKHAAAPTVSCGSHAHQNAAKKSTAKRCRVTAMIFDAARTRCKGAGACTLNPAFASAAWCAKPASRPEHERLVRTRADNEKNATRVLKTMPQCSISHRCGSTTRTRADVAICSGAPLARVARLVAFRRRKRCFDDFRDDRTRSSTSCLPRVENDAE